jgi:hypothetical protein
VNTRPRREPRVEFLAEQVGEVENDLKEALASHLLTDSTVERAYLRTP